MSDASLSAPTIVNVAAYRFAKLDELPRRRRELQELTRQLGLRGTILLSREGINLFVAGERESVDQLMAHLKSDPALADLTGKQSFSDQQPFNRMLVKIKREIIAFGEADIDPASYTSKRLEAKTLKRWLDEGRAVRLLDVRNGFEFDLGTFEGAERLDIDSFREFPAASAELPEEWKQETVVTFCTGGIRCEKAGPWMEKLGFQDVWQLEGGILKYFEECGADHYHGECFVFDKRVALDADLSETPTGLCFVCQRTLSEDDQQSPLFVEGDSCPHCHPSTPAGNQRRLAHRQSELERVATPLPGAHPYDNERPINIPARLAGMSLIDALVQLCPSESREEWNRRIERDLILFLERPAQPEQVVQAGHRFRHLEKQIVEPPVNAAIRLLVEDEAWVVVDKPAPLPVHPCGRYHRNTLTWMLNQVYRDCKLRPAHRLDANTRGLLILCKTREAAQFVQNQFERNEVTKVYRARVVGSPDWDDITCDQPIGEAAGTAGLRLIDPHGKPARTDFRVIDRHADGTTSVEATPCTGRTNQIRAHLWWLGHPIVGDPMYLPDQTTGAQQTLAPDDPPLELIATTLELSHPSTSQRTRLTLHG